jgi:DNA polymerase III delta prime subunit
LSATARLETLAGHPESFPGALLLTGSSAGRLEAEARRLATILLCPGDDPERRCDSCRRAEAGLHPDLLLLEPQGVQIRIDSVREALAFGAGKPYEASRRVAIVARAEQLGLEAGNALLKALEEPGRLFHWILTSTRAETLLPTVRSRCVAVSVAPDSRADRAARWVSRGFSQEDASDLADLEPDAKEDAAALLEEHRVRRATAVLALQNGVSQRRIAPLLLLAETLAQAEPSRARLLSELLADAAVAGAASGDLLRHQEVAGGILDLARRLSTETLRRAALKAADAPPDNRRGNKRLHYESVLLALMEGRKD